MPITTLKTSQDLHHSEPIDISRILSEVKRHGFYSNFCVNLVKDAENKDALVSEIRLIASKALLRVAFNADYTICIFED